MLRRVVVIVAGVAVTVCGVVWLTSWLPSPPLGEHWPAVVFPFFFLIFPCMAAVLYEQGSFSFDRSARRRIRLPKGWRRGVIGALGVLYVIGFASAFGIGQPEQVDGRYYDNDHGERTEITRSRFDSENAAASRIFAGGVVAFAGFALLTLTADRSAPDREDTERLRLTASTWSGSKPEDRGPVAGARVLQGEVPRDGDTVIRQLRLTVPISVSGTAARSVVVARWPERGFVIDRATDLWLMGTVEQTLRGSAMVHLEVRQAGPSWGAPTPARIVALCLGVPVAIVTLVVVAALVSPAALIGILFVAASALNLSIRWASTSSAVGRGTRRVAEAVGLPPP